MFGPDNDLRRAAVAQMAPHVDWISSQCKREALTDDGIGAAIHAGADAGEVTRQEAELLVRSLLSAGFDTTVHGLGAAMRQLALNPDQFAALRADPMKARAAFEEAVRLETPVQTFFRTTTREVEIGAATIPEGEKVLMLLGPPIAIRASGPTLTATTSTARPPATSPLARAFTCASANCSRASRARRCWERSRASSPASSRTASRRRS